MITFKEYLNETPLRVDDSQKEGVLAMARHLRDHIQSLDHSKSDNVHDFKVRTNHDGSKYYYQLRDGKVKAFSHITPDNIHQSTYREHDEPVSTIYKFMKHHSKVHGELKTQHTNTSGAISLWKNLVKSKPLFKSFHMTDGNTKTPINHTNIDSKTDEIWGPDKQNIQLVMKHTK